MDLDPSLTTYILEAFAKPLGMGGLPCRCCCFVVVVAVSLVSVVVVLGLINTVSRVDAGLKSF